MTTTTTALDVTVVSGPTSAGNVTDWELYFARRALTKLKSLLGREGLLELLEPDTSASAGTLAGWAAASDGRWQPALTHLRVAGVGAAEFVAYFHSLEADEPRLLAAEPEHFVLSRLDDGRVQVVENLSHHITDFRITFTSEDQAIDDLAADYPLRMVANVTLPDGTLIGHALHQFKETETGFDALLAIYFPAAAPEEFIEGHRQHLAVEFTNWINAAGEALGRQVSSRVPIVVTGSEVFGS